MYIDGNSFPWILLVALIGTALNYLVGDLFILPATSSTIASLGDGLTAALVAWATAWFTPQLTVSLMGLAVLFILVAMVEYFFHMFLVGEKRVAPGGGRH